MKHVIYGKKYWEDIMGAQVPKLVGGSWVWIIV